MSMPEDNFNREPLPPRIKEAVNSWSSYVKTSESLVHLTHQGFRQVTSIPELNEILYDNASEKLSPERAMSDKMKADDARAEAEAGFPHVHAHALLGLWGAFESFIEDLTIAVLDYRPQLLLESSFAKIKIPVSTLVLDNNYDRTSEIFFEASRSTGSDLSLGTSKFERQLRLAALDGAVPTEISQSIFQAQQVRNVWAHRGGRADARFVERCPGWNLEVGQNVHLDYASFSPLMHGIHMYSLVILNRFRQSDNREQLVAECPGFEGVFDLEEAGVRKLE